MVAAALAAGQRSLLPGELPFQAPQVPGVREAHATGRDKEIVKTQVNSKNAAWCRFNGLWLYLNFTDNGYIPAGRFVLNDLPLDLPFNLPAFAEAHPSDFRQVRLVGINLHSLWIGKRLIDVLPSFEPGIAGAFFKEVNLYLLKLFDGLLQHLGIDEARPFRFRFLFQRRLV